MLAAGPGAAQELGSPLPTLAPLVEKVAPAVVNISVSSPRPERAERGFGFPPELERELDRLFRGGPPPGNLPQEVRSAGSGVVVDSALGYIVTNHHVVEDATTILVTLNDNRGFEATVVGSDAASDIALLKVDSTALAQIELGDSDALRVGDYVVAIGNPFNFSNTVTAGIVSGLGRSGLVPELNMYESFIQTDASINPGNSGGALVNLRGELVGINSAIIAREGGGNVGIGFAIPVNMMRAVVDQLIAGGGVQRGYLGIIMSGLSLERSRELGLPDMAGAEVTDVTPGLAAARAGLQKADVIIAVNGRRVVDPGSLRATVGLLRPGEEVEITVIRAGRQRSLRATLGVQPAALARSAPRNGALLHERLAGSLIVDNLREDAPSGATPEPDGILIVNVESDSRAAALGLRTGDVITHVNGTRVMSMTGAAEVLLDAPAATLELRREGSPRVVITLN
jgi:Do/DeqQ family serine protease